MADCNGIIHGDSRSPNGTNQFRHCDRKTKVRLTIDREINPVVELCGYHSRREIKIQQMIGKLISIEDLSTGVVTMCDRRTSSQRTLDRINSERAALGMAPL